MSPETADYFVNLGERVGRAVGSGAFTMVSVAAFAWPFAHLVRFVRASRGRTARAPRIRWVLLAAFLASFIVELARETTLKLVIDIVEFGLLLLSVPVALTAAAYGLLSWRRSRSAKIVSRIPARPSAGRP